MARRAAVLQLPQQLLLPQPPAAAAVAAAATTTATRCCRRHCCCRSHLLRCCGCLESASPTAKSHLCCFATQGQGFDCYAKQWRLAADVMNDVGEQSGNVACKAHCQRVVRWLVGRAVSS